MSLHHFNILCDQLRWSPMKHFYILENYKRKNGRATISIVQRLNYPFSEQFYLKE